MSRLKRLRQKQTKIIDRFLTRGRCSHLIDNKMQQNAKSVQRNKRLVYSFLLKTRGDATYFSTKGAVTVSYFEEAIYDDPSIVRQAWKIHKNPGTKKKFTKLTYFCSAIESFRCCGYQQREMLCSGASASWSSLKHQLINRREQRQKKKKKTSCTGVWSILFYNVCNII